MKTVGSAAGATPTSMSSRARNFPGCSMTCSTRAAPAARSSCAISRTMIPRRTIVQVAAEKRSNCSARSCAKYSNQVLTVFCLPRECTRVRDIFYDYLGSTGIVELKEDFASGERAERFLKMLAKDVGVRTDKKLFAKLEDDKGYLVAQSAQFVRGMVQQQAQNSHLSAV